jgi:hypothetical protein
MEFGFPETEVFLRAVDNPGKTWNGFGGVCGIENGSVF